MNKWLFALLLYMYAPSLLAQKEFQQRYQLALIEAAPGTVIDLPEGKFILTNTLSLEGKQQVTIRGKGKDKTILSFINQKDGAEGIRVSNCSNITLEGFSVQDAKGDAIKTMHVKGIRFSKVQTEWTGTPGPQNGGYGLYPVQCDGVMIDACVAIGASDAGIYVGQSKNIVVKNCIAHHNVAGIEIENSQQVEVMNNEAYENAGGLLIFDLPDLVEKKGGQIKAHHNNIHDNNYPNFAPKGNIVATVPTGTGVLILATKEIELFENTIQRNQTVGIGIISYFTTQRPIKDSLYDPYPSAIYIHHNLLERNEGKPISKDPLGMVVGNKFGTNVPHILFDGIKNPKLLDAKGGWLPGNCIRIVDNTNQSIANLDVEHFFMNIGRADNAFACDRMP